MRRLWLVGLPAALVAAVLLTGMLSVRRGGTARAQVSESVPLVAGCNQVTLTFPNGTPAATVAATVTPASSLLGIWRLNPGTGRFEGFSPQAAVASDLTVVNLLDAVSICMSTPGTLMRPAITTATAIATVTPTPAASPAPTATPVSTVPPHIVAASPLVRRGGRGVVSVSTSPGDQCSVTYLPGGGVGTVSRITADASGIANFFFVVPATSPPGAAIVTITCRGISTSAVIEVV